MSSERIPKIAVLLAAYNGLNWLPDQVETILNQRDVSVSLFVSVDRSNDGTEEWFDRLADRDPRVKVLPHGRKFGGAARNFFRLIVEANLDDCDYVSFADQDDLWSETKLAKAAHVLHLNGYDGYSSNVTAFWPDGRQHLVHKAQAQKRWDYLFEAAGPGCTYVLKRSLLKLIRDKILSDTELVNNIYLHDWFCYAFARASNKRWYIDPEPSLFYRQHTSNQFGVNSGVKALFARISQFTGGFWLDQGALIARVIGVSDTRFVNKWKGLEPLGLIQLAASARRCRRSTRDQMGFFVLCVILAVKKSFTRG
jgi:rhamnosyltransferase